VGSRLHASRQRRSRRERNRATAPPPLGRSFRRPHVAGRAV